MSVGTSAVNQVIGILHMYEVPESIRISQDALERMWAAAALPLDLCPKARGPRDAFRRATPRRQPAGGLMLTEYKGKAVPKGMEMPCVLIRLIPTRTRAKFKQENCAVIGLDDQHELMIIPYMIVGPETNRSVGLGPEEQQYLGSVADAYALAKSTVDGGQIRKAFTYLLRRVQAVPFRDGAWMIPAQHHAISRGLVDLVAWVNATQHDDQAVMHTIDYLDTPQQLLQLDGIVSTFINREIKSKIEEALEYRQRRDRDQKPVGDEKRTTMLSTLLNLGTMITHYETVFQKSLSELQRQRAYAETAINQALG